jgi:hypothetical protein
MVLVTGVGLGGREAEVAFYSGQGGVPDPVHADLLCRDPREMLAKAPPEIVVASRAYWPAARISQHPSAWSETSSGIGMGEEMPHQRWITRFQ